MPTGIIYLNLNLRSRDVPEVFLCAKIEKIKKVAQVLQNFFELFGGVLKGWEIALVSVNKAVILRQAQDRSAKKYKSANVRLFYISPCEVKSYRFYSGNSGIVKSQKNDEKVRGFDEFLQIFINF